MVNPGLNSPDLGRGSDNMTPMVPSNPVVLWSLVLFGRDTSVLSLDHLPVSGGGSPLGPNPAPDPVWAQRGPAERRGAGAQGGPSPGRPSSSIGLSLPSARAPRSVWRKDRATPGQSRVKMLPLCPVLISGRGAPAYMPRAGLRLPIATGGCLGLGRSPELASRYSPRFLLQYSV